MRKNPEAGGNHVVELIGFCAELHSVALVLKWYDGGDLVHK